MRPSIIDKLNALRLLCSLSKECFANSKILNESEKAGWIAMVDYSEGVMDISEKGQKLSGYQIKSIEQELLKYWNENLNCEVERFWELISEKSLHFERSKTFENIISKRRFKNVEQAIQVYNEIFSESLTNMNSESLKSRLAQLTEVVGLDKERRIKQTKKWIRIQSVSFSDSLKFGENYAYLKRTGLFETLLDQKEKEILEKLAKK